MKRKDTKRDVKKSAEKILKGKFWIDPMCGPIRP